MTENIYQLMLDNLEKVNEKSKVVKTEDNASAHSLEILPSVKVESIPLSKEANDIIVKDDVIIEPNSLPKSWSEINVSLLNISTHFFEISNRPIIVVKNDVVEYINPVAIKILQLDSKSIVIGEKFLRFIDKKDWNDFASNIGDMITNGATLEVGLKSSSDRIVKTNFVAMVLQDGNHFSFVLIGSQYKPTPIIVKNEHINASHEMFDKETGLPSFSLFEDRLQVAINQENYKNIKQKKSLVAVIAITIENLIDFESLGIADFALKQAVSNLSQNIKKTSTIAKGLKCTFWVMLTDFYNKVELDLEIEKIQNIIKKPIVDNFIEHHVDVKMGAAIFPDSAKTARKLIKQAMLVIDSADKL